MTNLNILVLSELFYPHGSGGELATYLHTRLLSEAGFNVVVVTNRFAGESEFSRSGALIVYRLPLFNKANKYSLLIRFDVLMSQYIKKLMKWADVVYIPKFWFSAVPLAKAYGKSVIVHLHGYFPICPIAVLYNSKNDKICEKGKFCLPSCLWTFERSRRYIATALGSTFLNLSVPSFLEKCIKLCDAVVCVSGAHKDIITRYMPSLTGKVYVIYNPLPLLPFKEINGEDFGYFGGPSYLKGFYVLLKAMRYLQLRGLASFVIHATKFNHLNERIVALLRDMRLMLYPKLGCAGLDEIYQKVKAVVVPSLWQEPLPYVIAEALLRGRLVIASRVGGIPELVAGCKGAFLFEAGNYRELAGLMTYISGFSKNEIIELGYKNREVVMKKFDNNMIRKKFVNIIETANKNP